MVRIEPTQDEDADAGAEEGENRTGTACFSDNVNRCETGDAGDDDADTIWMIYGVWNFG